MLDAVQQAMTKEPAFGQCPSCGRSPEESLFDDRICWALCAPCRLAWWVMFSHDGWSMSAAEVGEARSRLAGWRARSEEEDAHFVGTGGEEAFSKLLGLPCRDGALNRDWRTPDGIGIHVRTSRFDTIPLIVTPNDPDNDIYVLVVGNGRLYHMAGWLLGGEAKQRGILVGRKLDG